MKHEATKQFWKYYNKLPHHIQGVADDKYKLLVQNPNHPSLNFGCKKEDLYGARVNLQYRALSVKIDSRTYVWFWIGEHDTYDRLIEDY